MKEYEYGLQHNLATNNQIADYISQMFIVSTLKSSIGQFPFNHQQISLLQKIDPIICEQKFKGLTRSPANDQFEFPLELDQTEHLLIICSIKF